MQETTDQTLLPPTPDPRALNGVRHGILSELVPTRAQGGRLTSQFAKWSRPHAGAGARGLDEIETPGGVSAPRGRGRDGDTALNLRISQECPTRARARQQPTAAP